jgi:hypothetical protein
MRVIITGRVIYSIGIALSTAISKVSVMVVVNSGEAVRVSIFLPLIYAKIAGVNLMTKPMTMMRTIMSMQNCRKTKLPDYLVPIPRDEEPAFVKGCDHDLEKIADSDDYYWDANFVVGLLGLTYLCEPSPSLNKGGDNGTGIEKEDS